jgi:hypothetical protein
MLAMAALVIWYWRYGADLPEEIGLVLAVLPLFLAWRSLTTYFYFVGLPAVVLLIARQKRKESKQVPAIAAADRGGGQEYATSQGSPRRG